MPQPHEHLVFALKQENEVLGFPAAELLFWLSWYTTPLPQTP